jgi:hypothetical protein
VPPATAAPGTSPLPADRAGPSAPSLWASRAQAVIFRLTDSRRVVSTPLQSLGGSLQIELDARAAPERAPAERAPESAAAAAAGDAAPDAASPQGRRAPSWRLEFDRARDDPNPSAARPARLRVTVAREWML